MSLTTRKKHILAALQGGDATDELVCLHQERTEGLYGKAGPITRCSFDEMPEREFDDGYGGEEGDLVIAFSKRHVYICGHYDGAEWMQAIPRNPEDVTHIPTVGG